jgi:hypothetical protein
MELKDQFGTGGLLKEVQLHGLILNLFLEWFGYKFRNGLDIDVICFTEVNDSIDVTHILVLLYQTFDLLGKSRRTEKLVL